MKPRPLVLAILGLVLLASCGSGSSAATVAGQAAATTAPGNTFSDAEFYGLVREDDGGYFDGKPDSEIESAAKLVCGIFTPSTGGSATTQWAATVKGLIGLGLDARAAGGFMVYAVSQHCIQEAKYLPKG